MQDRICIAEEIDLRELFKIIWNKKIFILAFTLIITLISLVYVLFKNPVPIYQGNMLIEIGEIQSETFGSKLLDNPRNLSIIINREFGVKVTVPSKTNNLIKVLIKSTNKDEIKAKSEKVIVFVKERNKIKSGFYKNTIMTKEIGNVLIDSRPINTPKKKLIVFVSFVTGFILSIFLVLFMSFINNICKEDNDSFKC